jgi:hypothetical protein
LLSKERKTEYFWVGLRALARGACGLSPPCSGLSPILLRVVFRR